MLHTHRFVLSTNWQFNTQFGARPQVGSSLTSTISLCGSYYCHHSGYSNAYIYQNSIDETITLSKNNVMALEAPQPKEEIQNGIQQQIL